MKVDLWDRLIEIKYGSKAYVNDPFMPTQQAVQMYYTLFLSRKRGKKDWWAVCKVKSRVIHYVLEKKEELQLSKYF